MHTRLDMRQVLNSMDMVGRLVAGRQHSGKTVPSSLVLLVYCFARFGLVAGLLVCNVVTPRNWALPVLLRCARPARCRMELILLDVIMSILHALELASYANDALH